MGKRSKPGELSLTSEEVEWLYDAVEVLIPDVQVQRGAKALLKWQRSSGKKR